MNKTSVTIKEIAGVAGCSPRAAAAVLSPGGGTVRVGGETQRRVLEIAREMGYRRNELARAMVSGKSNVIGLLTSVGGSETVMRIIEGALDEAAARGYITKILRLPYYATLEQVREGVELCTAWQLDGVVAVGLREDVLACLSREIESNRRPVAYIESFPQGSPEIRVGSDDAGGVRLGLEHLAALGHRSIAFLGGAPESSISQGRAHLFAQTCHALGLPVTAASSSTPTGAALRSSKRWRCGF
jgi:LacI family transcriptional regulator